MDRQTLRDLGDPLQRPWPRRGSTAAGATGVRPGWRHTSRPSLCASSWRAPIQKLAAFRPSRARIGCASAKPASARHSTPPRWAASSGASASRGKRRGRATRRKTRPRRRPLKRAPALLKNLQCTHKNKRIRLFFQDEARIGQKGRVCHVRWKRGQRPPGLADKRFTFAYIFAAVEPGAERRSSSAPCGSAQLVVQAQHKSPILDSLPSRTVRIAVHAHRNYLRGYRGRSHSP